MLDPLCIVFYSIDSHGTAKSPYIVYIEDLTSCFIEFLLNKLGKRDKMRGLSLFRNEINKFIIQEHEYHMTKILKKCILV